MFRFLVRLSFCLLLIAAAPLSGQQPQVAETAEQLATHGLVAYTAGNWAEAEKALAEFVAQFGKSAQVTMVLPRIYPPLALSRARLGKYQEALDTIKLAIGTYAKDIPQPTMEELRFWQGLCEAEAGDEASARATLLTFVRDYPRSEKRTPALLFIAALWVKEEKWKEAIAFLAEIKPQLGGVDRGRVVLLELYSRVKSDDRDSALRLVVEEGNHLENMVQLVGFQMLVLELGGDFYDRSEYYKAIACLQRVWSRDRLLKHQRERLEAWRLSLERAEAAKAPAHLIFQHRQLIAQIEKELESFEKMKQFDSALRFRMAASFLGMERYREAALIMEGMLEDLPPDALVEKATTNLVQCWMQIERWPKALAAAQAFEEKFPQSKDLPLVLVMKGQAQQNEYQYAESVATLDQVVTRFPNSEWAPRALFMKGFAQALLEDFAAAITTLGSFGQKYPKDPLAENALYWTGLTYSTAKDYAQARVIFDACLQRYKGGTLTAETTFRRAYCLHAQKQYEAAIPEFRAYLEAFPKGEDRSEALAMLGDALMATGDLEAGRVAFLQIPPVDKRFFEEGWFKVGKAWRAEEQFVASREHMEKFLQEHPQSSRVPEALYWIGWAHRAEGHPERTADTYWAAIRQYGNDPALRAVEDLFPALAKLAKGDAEKAAYNAKLRDLREEADGAGRKTLALRALWAQAQFLTKTDPVAARKILLDATPRLNVQTDNTQLLADFADALRESERAKDAEQLYRDLLKWNPRAPQKDRVFAGLGLIAKADGREKAALDYFARFEKETFDSPLFAEVMLAKSELLAARGQTPEAKAALEALLAQKIVRGDAKARALYQIGELHMKAKQPQLAVPYYQRLYIMQGRWPEFVAKAYLRSGEAFEQLADKTAAQKTYAEFVGREELQKYAEFATAKQRLAALEGLQ
jgi:TolA-binding protein